MKNVDMRKKEHKANREALFLLVGASIGGFLSLFGSLSANFLWKITSNTTITTDFKFTYQDLLGSLSIISFIVMFVILFILVIKLSKYNVNI